MILPLLPAQIALTSSLTLFTVHVGAALMDGRCRNRWPSSCSVTLLLSVLLVKCSFGLTALEQPLRRDPPDDRSVAPPVVAAAAASWSDVNLTLSTGLYRKGLCGLMNQHMKLLVFLTVAVALRVNHVVIPLALSRDSFDTSTALWQEEPAASLWDIHSIRGLLRRHGITTSVAQDNLIPADAVRLQRRPRSELRAILGVARHNVDERLGQLRREPASSGPPPGAVGPPTAPATTTHTTPASLTVSSTTPSRSAGPASAGVSPASASPTRAGAGPASPAPGSPSYGSGPAPRRHQVWLHADNLFWVLETQHLRQYADVARDVLFNPALVSLASMIASNLRAASPTGIFNGLHLRVEKDWTDTKQATAERLLANLDEYAALMHAAAFSASPCYIASGIFDPATGVLNRALYGDVEVWLQRNASVPLPFVNRHTTLGGLLPHGGLRRLHSEQAALLDFLVLQHAEVVVGLGPSSFSYNLREFRALRGRPRNSTRLVNAAQVGHLQVAASLAV